MIYFCIKAEVQVNYGLNLVYSTPSPVTVQAGSDVTLQCVFEGE